MVLLPPWYYLASVLAIPAIAPAGEVMRGLFMWVEDIERAGTVATLVTRIPVVVQQGGGYMRGVVTPDADFLTYGYGVALLWALLLASRPNRLVVKGVLGSVVLIPFQSWGLCFEWMKDIAFCSGPAAQDYMRLPGLVLDATGFGYQFGYLVLTPTVPVLLWLALDKRFMMTLWLEASLAGQGDKPRAA